MGWKGRGDPRIAGRDTDLVVDEKRTGLPSTGIYVRARGADGRWGNHDIAHLDEVSISLWIDGDLAKCRRTLLHLLGHNV